MMARPHTTHYHAMDYWETYFPELSNYVKGSVYRSAITNLVKKTIVKAEVKAGKRLVAECFAAYTNCPGRIINAFMSAYVRKADIKQRDALKEYMPGGVFALNTKKHAIECKKSLRVLRQSYPNAKIVIHFDEFDHGSGSNQVLGTSGLWGYILACPMIHVIQYSASPEEGLLGDDESRQCIPMPTHPNYRGAQYYLDKNLIVDAEHPLRFSDDDPKRIVGMGNQVNEIIDAAREQVRRSPRATSRNIVIIRITDGFADVQELYQQRRIPELLMNDDDDVIVTCDFVASTSSGTKKVNWDDYSYWQDEVKRLRRMNAVCVLFIDKMCTRSTDWFCHPFLFAYHDYHGEQSALNTIIQSNLRVAFYQGKKNDRGEVVYPMEDHPIRLYGSRDVIEFVAGLRTLDQLGRRVSSRAKVTSADPGIWGRPMRFVLPSAVVADSRLSDTLRDDRVREWIKSQLLAADGITNDQRLILQHRRLQGKRNYFAHNTLGGIHTVHGRYVQGRESAPGGGIPNEDVFDRRNAYFWLDIAQEQTEGIPACTVYVTYGVVSEDEDNEDNYTHSLATNRDGTSCSIFGVTDE